MAKYKRRDGTLVPETDPMHLITPHMVPDRCDNEAVLTELFDMTAVEAYLDVYKRQAAAKAATMPAATARSRGAGGRRPRRLRWRIIL